MDISACRTGSPVPRLPRHDLMSPPKPNNTAGTLIGYSRRRWTTPSSPPSTYPGGSSSPASSGDISGRPQVPLPATASSAERMLHRRKGREKAAEKTGDCDVVARVAQPSLQDGDVNGSTHAAVEEATPLGDVVLGSPQARANGGREEHRSGEEENEERVWEVEGVSALEHAARGGDVVLFRCRGLLSRLQRWVLRSEWDHVGVVSRAAQEVLVVG